MFERYTEKARRVIFFARYEASQLGGVAIEPEHILLGLLREDKQLARFLRGPQSYDQSLREEIKERMPVLGQVAASVDMPLSIQAKRVLNYAAEESEMMKHRNIGTDHLLLGILREKESVAAEVLRQRGLSLAELREEVQRSQQSGVGETGMERVAGRRDIHSNDFAGTFPFESAYYAAPDGRMAYIDEGRGEPVIMLHGNPTWSYLYRKFIPPIAEARRAIAVDHLGFGRSDKPVKSLRLEDHIKNFSELALKLDLRNATLVMQDWGGPIGLGFGTRFPDRIKRLVVMNTWEIGRAHV